MTPAHESSKPASETPVVRLARASLLTGAVVLAVCAPLIGRRYTLWAWHLAAALALAVPALLKSKALRSSLALLELLFGIWMLFGLSENGVFAIELAAASFAAALATWTLRRSMASPRCAP